MGILDAPTVPASQIDRFPVGAVSSLFQPAKYGVKADAVVDAYGTLISGTDDTAAWLALIAALPTDTAIIRLHGISRISNTQALSWALGFNTNRLSIVGDGPGSGFVLAAGSNSNALRFNTTSVNLGPQRLSKLLLQNFSIYHQGWSQNDPAAGGGAITIYAVDHVRLKGVHGFNCRSLFLQAHSVTDLDVDEDCLVDTIVPGASANGINFQGSSTGRAAHASIRATFIDVPDKAIDAATQNARSIKQSAKFYVRNVLPYPTTVPGSTLCNFTSDQTTAAGYGAATDYAPGTAARSGGFNYMCIQNNGPGSTVVAPGTDQTYWVLQNRPQAWSNAANYLLGQTVAFTPPTPTQWSSGSNYAIGASISYQEFSYTAAAASGPGNGGAVTPGTDAGATWTPGALTILPGENLTFTALAPSGPGSGGAAQPVTNGVLSASWRIGGPLFAGSAMSGASCETSPTNPSSDLVITGCEANGRNAAGTGLRGTGEYVMQYGVQLGNSSGSAGTAGRNATVTANVLRGMANTGISGVDDLMTVVANTMEDCTNGIVLGTAMQFTQRSLIAALNTIKLGGLGNGTAISVSKGVGSAWQLIGVGLDTNEIDGGVLGDGSITAALTSGVAITSIAVTPLKKALPVNTPIVIGVMTLTQFAAVLAAPAALGATTLTVASVTPGVTFNAGTNFFMAASAQLSGSLTNGGGAITALPVNAIPAPIQAGTNLTIPNSVAWSNNFTVTTTASVAAGATSIPIQSATPPTTYASGQPVVIVGQKGYNLVGALYGVTLKGGMVQNCAGIPVSVQVSTGTPDKVDIDGLWLLNSGGNAVSIGSSVTNVNWRGGGWERCGSPSIPGTGANTVRVQDVLNQTPIANPTLPTLPASAAAAIYSALPYDTLVWLTAGAADVIVKINSTGGNSTNAVVTIPATTTGVFIWKARQKLQLTYASGAPTWVGQGL